MGTNLDSSINADIQVKHFDEDECCDYCGMEIYGPGVPSGYTPENSQYRSGWMHQDIEYCAEMIRVERDNAQFQDGSRNAWGRSPKSPPNAPKDWKFKDR